MVTDRLGETTTRVYDSAGRLSTLTDAESKTTTYTYDALDRKLTTTYPDSSVTTIDYDPSGTFPTGSTAHKLTFDTDKSKTSISSFDGTLDKLEYRNSDGTLVGTDDFSYDALLRQSGSTSMNGITRAMTYTDSNKLGETWSGAMANWSFTTQKAGGTYVDGYDQEDRFRRFIRSGQSEDIYLARSDIGNISDVEINSTSHVRSYSSAHEVTSVDSTSQSFDDDGNLTAHHSGVTLGWDTANRMTQTVVPSGATMGIEGTNDYGYDADGKRTWKKVTRNSVVVENTVYIYAGPNCVAEYNYGGATNAPVMEYIYAGEIDSLAMIARNNNAQKLIATRNQQWSIVSLNDNANGNVLERYTYDQFGKRKILAPDGSTVRTSSSYDNPYGYTSRRHDAESGLMYFRARFYDVTTGEFTSRDPLDYVDGMSLMRGYFILTEIDWSGKWRVDRANGPKAVAVAEAFDTIVNLAHQIGLDEDEYREWLSSNGSVNSELQGETCWSCIGPREELCEGTSLQVPNTMFAVWFGDVAGLGRWWVTWDNEMQYLRDRGFKVVERRHDIEEQKFSSVDDFYSQIHELSVSKTLHGLYEWGHGWHTPPGFGTGDWFMPKDDRPKGDDFWIEFEKLGASLNYKLAFTVANSCFSEHGKKYLKSKNGIYAGHIDVLDPSGLGTFGICRIHYLKDVFPPGTQKSK